MVGRTKSTRRVSRRASRGRNTKKSRKPRKSRTTRKSKRRSRVSRKSRKSNRRSKKIMKIVGGSALDIVNTLKRNYSNLSNSDNIKFIESLVNIQNYANSAPNGRINNYVPRTGIFSENKATKQRIYWQVLNGYMIPIYKYNNKVYIGLINGRNDNNQLYLPHANIPSLVEKDQNGKWKEIPQNILVNNMLEQLTNSYLYSASNIFNFSNDRKNEIAAVKNAVAEKINSSAWFTFNDFISVNNTDMRRNQVCFVVFNPIVLPYSSRMVHIDIEEIKSCVNENRIQANENRIQANKNPIQVNGHYAGPVDTRGDFDVNQQTTFKIEKSEFDIIKKAFTTGCSAFGNPQHGNPQHENQPSCLKLQ